MNRENSLNKWSLCTVYLLSFTSSASVSVIAPFFPTEAAKKGMSASTSGYVFSIYGATLIIMNSFVGKILPCIGNKVALATGIAILGPANILFGLLEDINDYYYFTVLCFVVRVIEAIGAALITTTTFMTILKMYPENSSKKIAMNESVVSAGYMLGPVIGSALFAIRGYSIPFIALGVAVLLNLPLAIFLLRSYKKSDSMENSQTSQISYMKLISIFDVFFVCLILFTITVDFASVEATLGLHLESYNIKPSISGLLFFVPSAAYCLGSAVTGYLYSKTKSNEYYIIGLCISALGFLCIGPFSLIKSIRSIYLVIFSLFLIGFGCACVIIPTMPSAIKAVKRRGFQESITTCSLVSGLWTTVYSLGYVIGPMFGAVIFDKFGFAIYTISVASINLIVAILCCYVFISEPEDEETHHLFCSQNTKRYDSNENKKDPNI